MGRVKVINSPKMNGSKEMISNDDGTCGPIDARASCQQNYKGVRKIRKQHLETEVVFLFSR